MADLKAPHDERPEKGEGATGQAHGIQSMEIGIAVLKALAQHDLPMTLSAVAQAVDMPPSSCRRYLLSLIRTGLVQQESRSGKYDLGSGLLKLGLQALSRFDIVGSTIERALDLRDETKQTTVVSIFGEKGPTVIGWFDGSPRLIVNSHFGSVYSLLGTATGRVFLSFLPDIEARPLLKAEMQSSKTARAAKSIEELIFKIRDEMYCLIRDEVLPGLGAIAAPVFDAQGNIACVITIITRSSEMQASYMAELTAAVREAASSVSKAAGFASFDEKRSLAKWLAETWRK